MHPLVRKSARKNHVTSPSPLKPCNLFHCFQCMSPFVNMDVVDMGVVDMDVVDMDGVDMDLVFLFREMIKHHTILQRIPSLNRPDSRPLGLVNIYDRIDTFAGQLLKHWVKAVRELCAVVRAQVAALGRSQRVSEVGLQGLGQLKKEDKVTF